MASRPTKVRFVKCPKCKEILPEFADIPVYQCGGCGTVLKAKYREVGGESCAVESCQSSERKPEDAESVASLKQPMVHCSSDEDVFQVNQGNVALESGRSDKNLSENGDNNDDVALSGEVSLRKEELSENGRSSGESNGSGEGGTSDVRRELPDQSKEENSNRTDQSEIIEKVPDHNLDCENQSQEDREIKPQHYMDDEEGTSSGQLLSNNVKMRDTMDESTESVISEDVVDTKNNEKIENLLKSPTTRSYFAYYGSNFSNGDDFDYHAFTRSRNPQVSKRLFKPSRVTDCVSTEGKQPRRENLVVDKMSTDPVLQAQVAELSQLASVASSDRYGTAYSQSVNWDQEEQLESICYGFQTYERESQQVPKVSDPVRSRMESENAGPSRFLPRVTPDRRYSPSVHQHSNLLHNGHEELERFDQHQLDLLQKVERLTGQLSRLSGQSGRGRGKFPVGGQAQEVLPDYSANHVKRHFAAYEKRRMVPQYHESSKVHFSGPTNCRYHGDYSCSFCCPDGWQRSVQLPPICYNKGLCQSCAVHIRHHSYGPSPASSQQLSGSNFHGPFFHNNSAPMHEERLLDHEMEMLHYRERRNMLKRHCRPIVGGAPFITCYKCCKLLQIPADFLPTRRHQKLRCGACSEVLTFAIQGKNHIIPFRPIDEQHHLLPSTSQEGLPQGDPVSCSDDYGYSFCYYSTEGGTSKNDMQDKMQASSSSVEPILDRKIVCEPSEKRTDNRQGSKLVFKASKLGKSVESSPRSTSPLHRLMGYSSPSEIINGSAYVADKLLHSDVTSKGTSKENMERKGLTANGTVCNTENTTNLEILNEA
ncbi:protein ENHANCED DISEASE RESISTANCE 4 [Aristolochia californica]|uniref:protein ENHANCED DISEASE RESISTANCE 4 n=1 Tax=Aristolochia californica TaxID=171875 RepID=UPI0035D7D33B